MGGRLNGKCGYERPQDKRLNKSRLFKRPVVKFPFSTSNSILLILFSFAWGKKLTKCDSTPKQVTLRCVSNFVRNISSTYCSKENMECLPSSCEKSLSKKLCQLAKYKVVRKNRANWPVKRISHEMMVLCWILPHQSLLPQGLRNGVSAPSPPGTTVSTDSPHSL